MSITSVLQKAGTWTIGFKDTMPLETMNAIDYFEHMAFIPGHVDVKGLGDQLLDMARYVGIIRNKNDVSIGGIDMSGWLGDESQKGQVYETAIIMTDETFANAIRRLLPDAVHEGTIHSVPGSITETVVYQDPRTAIDYVTTTFSSTIVEGIHVPAAPVSWRVNNDATLDAGLASDLYVTDPTAVIVSKNWGADLNLVALQGSINPSIDAKNYVTRVLLMGQGQGPSVAVGTAEAAEVNYFDMFGNPVVRTQMVSQSTTSIANVDAQAQVALNANSQPIRSLSMDTTEYDIAGDFHVGDMVWVFDPASGLMDETNPIPFRGQLIYPTKIQCIQLTIPILDGYTVAWRDKHGTWTDLTQYYQPETGSTSVEVADTYSTLLVGASEAVQPRLTSDTTAPNPPTISSVLTASYLAGDGQTKARFIISWATPLNPDGSDITDGAYYTVRYKVHGTTSYTYDSVGWGTNVVTIGELSNGTNYDISVQAVDTSGNQSGYDTDATYTAEADNIPPSQPAAPTVAGNPLAIQVISNLGKNTGGTYNLENDLAFLFVYASLTSGFTPGAGNYVGRIPCGNGNLLLDIPAIGSFPVANGAAMFVKITAVDASGNESLPSPQASATALLIETANIANAAITNLLVSDVSATKLTSGSIGAETITLAGSTSVIESNGFLSGSVGWQVLGNGDSEFNNVVVRGLIESSDIQSSTIESSTITGGLFRTAAYGPHISIGAGAVEYITFQSGSINQIDAGNIYVAEYLGSGHEAWIMQLTPPLVTTTSDGVFFQLLSQDLTGVGEVIYMQADNDTFVSVQGGTNIITLNSFNSQQIRIDNPDIYINTDATTGWLFVNNGGYSTALMSQTGGVTTIGFPGLPSDGSQPYLRYAPSGGQIFYDSSSARFKHDIRDLHEVYELDIIDKIRPVAYKEDAKTPDEPENPFDYPGYIAEELAEVMPSLVVNDPEGNPLSVLYEKASVLTLAAVQDLRRRVAALECKPVPEKPITNREYSDVKKDKRYQLPRTKAPEVPDHRRESA